MNIPKQQLMKDLETPETCLCLNKNSCCIIYGFKPFIKILKQYNIFKPCYKYIKKAFISCFMACDSCSLGIININGKE